MSNFALEFLLPLYFFFSHIWALWQKFLPPGNSDSPISSYSPISYWLILGETFPSAFVVVGMKSCVPYPKVSLWISPQDFAATFRWQSDTVSSWQYKIIGAPKKFKKWPVLYLGLTLTIHVVKSQIHLRGSPFKVRWAIGIENRQRAIGISTLMNL